MLEYNNLSGKDSTIQLSINSKFNIINNNINLSYNEMNINNAIDNENVIHKNMSPFNLTLNFFNNGYYYDNFIYSGLNEDDIEKRNKFYRYSSIIMFLFDGINIENQNILHISYIPLYLLNKNNGSSTFIVNTNDEYNYFYLNKTIDYNKKYYVRFFFNNIKTGKVLSFRNNNLSLSEDNILYYSVNLFENKTIYFNEENIILNQIDNIEYDNKLLNNTLNNINITPNLNLDKLFNINGQYINL